MRFVIQRVNNASIQVNHEIISKIGRGFLVLIGISKGDTKETADKLIKKLTGMRIFSDENDKINLSLNDVHGSLLLVSQFTLYANCKKGNRPSFIDAEKPEAAKEIYEYIIEECEKIIDDVQSGIFGADMKIQLENDGPFTILLDSDDL